MHAIVQLFFHCLHEVNLFTKLASKIYFKCTTGQREMQYKTSHFIGEMRIKIADSCISPSQIEVIKETRNKELGTLNNSLLLKPKLSTSDGKKYSLANTTKFSEDPTASY
jgi:hypothetical protein